MQCLENTQKTQELHLKLQPCVSMLKSMTNQTNQPTNQPQQKNIMMAYMVYMEGQEKYLSLLKK